MGAVGRADAAVVGELRQVYKANEVKPWGLATVGGLLTCSLTKTRESVRFIIPDKLLSAELSTRSLETWHG